jgi:hypothetical protein
MCQASRFEGDPKTEAHLGVGGVGSDLFIMDPNTDKRKS